MMLPSRSGWHLKIRCKKGQIWETVGKGEESRAGCRGEKLVENQICGDWGVGNKDYLPFAQRNAGWADFNSEMKARMDCKKSVQRLEKEEI